MKIRSSIIKAGLHIFRFSGDVIDKGDYIVVHTPSNPEYWFGNHLIFKAPPKKGDFEKWCRVFKEEIYDKNKSHHMLFRWDGVAGEKGDISAFEKNDFHVVEDVLLSAHEVNPPPHPHTEISIRSIKTDAEWEMAFNNQVICRDEGTTGPLSSFMAFKRIQMRQYRLMCEQGLGEWYGAFLKNRMVADMAVFFVDGVGILEDVGTDPAFRRQGICGTAVYHISRELLDSGKVGTMAMTADENYHAARIYESVGYRPTERSVHMYNPHYFAG